MECPKCKFQNRDGAISCKGCGNKFEITYPNCQTSNLDAFMPTDSRKKGNIQGAKDQLTKAFNFFRACDADGWVKKIEQELATL